MVVTDQPFYVVNDVEFRELLTYTHHPSPTLKIPLRNAMKERIMKLGDDTIRETRQMFKVCAQVTRHIVGHLIFTSLHRPLSKARLVSPLMHGRQATISRSWLSSPIT
jgi:hypothetical protein